jgi:hypothetical protein
MGGVAAKASRVGRQRDGSRRAEEKDGKSDQKGTTNAQFSPRKKTATIVRNTIRKKAARTAICAGRGFRRHHTAFSPEAPPWIRGRRKKATRSRRTG